MTDKADVPIVPIVDTRSRAEKIGEFPARPGIKNTDPRAILKRNATLSTSDKEARTRARKLALDYCEQAILNLVDKMQTGSATASIEASKQILHMGLGKPATVHMGGEIANQAPHLTIVFGNSDPIPFETFQNLTVDYKDAED